MAASLNDAVLWIIVVWAAVLTAVSAKHFGYDGLHCTHDRNKSPSFPCHEDCVKNHNAEYGKCSDMTHEEFTCFCSQPKSTFNPDGQQCLNATNPRYDSVCRMDCRCNHAALDSKCHYDTHTCECIGQQKDKHMWKKLCPFERKEDFLKFLHTQLDISKKEANGTWHC